MEPKIDLMIIGAPKAGTTSLNNYLTQHPNIYTHFVMYNPEMMQAVYKTYPDCKVVAVLRNPISRAFSAFKYCRMNGVEPYERFEDAVFIDDKSRFKNDKKFERNCAYVFRSSYLQHIKNVYSIFPQDNVRIYLFEEIADNSTRPLNEIASLLNLPPFEFDISKRYNEGSFSKSPFLAKTISQRKSGLFKKFFTVEQRMKMKLFLKKLNAGRGKPEQRIMLDTTRSYLTNTFRSEVIELEKVLDLPFKKYWPEFFTI